ncbi:GntR family transcriptional regulator [Streptosporangiaceae bacterium NEAU-GS5]|nr:GntR family transcriptional regulator [Streptosporangiaceae bacterium NEAU-GS5]
MPIYKQLADIIRGQIERGEFAPGDLLPSEAELEAEYKIARLTVRRAVRELRDQGVAYTVQGEGTFVGPPDAPRSADQLHRYQRIARELSERIKSGELPPNKPIPSEQTLMKDYTVAKATIRKSMKLLREQGWVFTVAYRGTYPVKQEDWPQ